MAAFVITILIILIISIAQISIPQRQVVFFLNAPLLFLHSSKILPRLFFQIFPEAEVIQQIFLQFFDYGVNFELLLQASCVLYSHTNTLLIYQC